jgi:hypothetical protein
MNPDDDLPRLRDVCHVAWYVGHEQLRQGKELVVRLVAMLTKMCG